MSDLGDPQAWLADLQAAYTRSLDEGAARWREANAAVEAGRAPASALAEVAIAALESMGPDDPTSLGMSACEALRVHGGAEVRDRLRQARPRLPARKGLRDWRVDADRAIEVIEARIAGGCTCAAEARRGAAVHGPQWTIEDQQIDRAQYCATMKVRCARCGARWKVRRDDGYHYPVFSWTQA